MTSVQLTPIQGALCFMGGFAVLGALAMLGKFLCRYCSQKQRQHEAEGETSPSAPGKIHPPRFETRLDIATLEAGAATDRSGIDLAAIEREALAAISPDALKI